MNMVDPASLVGLTAHEHANDIKSGRATRRVVVACFDEVACHCLKPGYRVLEGDHCIRKDATRKQ